MSLPRSNLNRRQLLGSILAAGATPFIGGLIPGSAVYAGVPASPVREEDEKAATAGRIKQSVCFWCFNTAGEKWDAEKT